MPRGILDAIYWRLHLSYLTNRRDDSGRYLAMLTDEMKGSESKLASEIGPAHMDRFRKMRDRIAVDEFGRLHGEGYEATTLAPEKPEVEDKNEIDFCQELMKNRICLCNAIGCSPRASISSEHDMGEYGRCDFFSVENRVAKILEVKMGVATHALVAQIDKYRTWAELNMCLHQYDSVEAYVLTGSYPKYVLAELGKASVVALTHSGKPETIKRLV